MITRIVKLSFDPLKVEEFLILFKKMRVAIESSSGCFELRLMKDELQPNVFFTISKWESELFLNEYRKSELFNSIWEEVKKLFNAKPEAWSLRDADL